MKKALAVITAVTLAAGISIAAVVLPATAADTSAAVAAPTSTSAAPSTSTPAATPSSSTASPMPTPTPASTTTSGNPGTQPPAASFVSFTTAKSDIVTTDTSTDPYVTVVWSMPSWAGSTTATYGQTLVSETNEQTENLNVTLPTACDTQYQIDVYNNTSAFRNFISTYLTGTLLQVGLDNNYLATQPNSGWGYAYELEHVTSPNCTWPCISDSTVEYTYSHSAANSGEIIVPQNPDGSNGVLCTPFNVTATSWTYDNATTWPQTIDKYDHVLDNGTIDISHSGTYHYAAQVTCGQGDIYAWDSKVPASYQKTIYPENDNLPGKGILTAPGTPLPEYFLSEMGFTPLESTTAPFTVETAGQMGNTYYNDGASCWTTTPPSYTYASCASPNGNTISLPAVKGGEWTIGAKVYADDTAVTDFVVTGTSDVTIKLQDDNSSDAYSVTTQSFTYTPVDVSTLDCNVVTPIAPSATPITACDTTGSILITPTENVDYYIGSTLVYQGLTPVDVAATSGLSGTVTVIAKAEGVYHFDVDTTKVTSESWTFPLGSTSDCTVTTTYDTCISSNGISTEAVNMTFTNGGTVGASFKVVPDGNNADIATQSTQTYSVGAGKTSPLETVAPSAVSGDVFHVFINNVAVPADDVTVTFTGCNTTVIPQDPSVTPATCSPTTTNHVSFGTASAPLNNATISVDLEKGLVYDIKGPAGFTELTNVTGTTGPTVIQTGIPAGTYTVTVTAATGYVLDPSIAPTHTYTLPLAQVVCDTNATYSIAVCTTLTSASITVTLDQNLVYTAKNETDGTSFVITQTTTPITDVGVYDVTATLSAYGLTHNATLPGNASSVKFGPFDLSLLCPLPTLASWNANATSTNAVCTSTSATDGTITLTHDANQVGQVTYTVQNDSTKAVVYSGTNTVEGDTVLNEGPGTYTVRATATNPQDGLSGSTSQDGSESWTLTITATGVDCDGNLAFTGGTIAWLGFVLAGGMLFIGFALLLIRRRKRTAE